MAILIENNKLRAVIQNGPKSDLQVYSEAIHSVIDFYLCKEPFAPIQQGQAGNIYFLKWLDKCLSWEPPKDSKTLGKVVCIIPKNDVCLLESFIQSLDLSSQDILHHGSYHGINQTLCDRLFFINVLRNSLSPNLDEIRNELRKTVVN
ncbi:hypothetical protein [Cecembia lonarensis]|nr:hypothetical protein [Cecembia lonarensis]